MTTHNSQYSAETTHPDKQESSPAPTAAGTCTATLPAISWISVEFHG